MRMNKNVNMKTLILAAAASLGLTLSAYAGNANTQVPVPGAATAGDMLGRNSVTLTYDYYDLQDGPPSVARGYTFEANFAVRPQLDIKLVNEFAQAEAYGVKAHQTNLLASAVAYTTEYSWGKPYIEVGAGWTWLGAPANQSDDSFALRVGVGSEFQVSPSITLTPYVNLFRATHFNDTEYQTGVKATFRMGDAWALFAKAQYNDVYNNSNNTGEYSVGVNYRF